MNPSHPQEIDSRLLPDRGISILSAPRIIAHTAFSSFRDYERSPSGPSIDGPVFIVGSPRSGTTVFAHALGAVPGMSYHFEPVATKAAVPYMYLKEWSDENGRRWFRGVHSGLQIMHRARRKTVIDKTPRYVFIAEQLAAWFPSSKFIVLVRDGRDVAASWSEKQWMAGGASKRFEPGGYKYGPYPRFWVEQDRLDEFSATTAFHRAAWGWRRHVEHWSGVRASIPESRRLEIRYESMATNPAQESQRVAQFLDLNAEGHDRLAEHLSVLDPGSVGRWTVSDLGSDPRAVAEMQRALTSLGYDN